MSWRLIVAAIWPGDDAGAETPESGSFNAASPRSLAFRGSAGCQGVAGGFDAQSTGLLLVLLPLLGRRLRKKR